MFKRRIGVDPHLNGEFTSSSNGCPDVWELQDGNFAVIGVKKTDELRSMLPKTASCGPDEEIVVIPRNTLVRGKKDIPDV